MTEQEGSVFVVTRTTPFEQLPELLDVTEAATVLGVGRGSVYQAVHKGDLDGVRVGRLLRIPRHSLMALAGKSQASR